MKWKKPPVDLNVLAMVSDLDTDNQESFKKLKEYAMRELEAKVFGKGKLAGIESLETEKAAEVVKAGKEKADTIKKNADGKHKTETLRQWNLTPPELKALLPGGGSIAGVFYMRWHPVQHFWRVTYPTGHLIGYYDVMVDYHFFSLMCVFFQWCFNIQLFFSCHQNNFLEGLRKKINDSRSAKATTRTKHIMRFQVS